MLANFLTTIEKNDLEKFKEIINNKKFELNKIQYDLNNETPLTFLIKKYFSEEIKIEFIQEILKNKNLDVTIPNKEGYQPIDLLIIENFDSYGLIDLIINHSTFKNIYSSDGISPFFRSVFYGNKSIINKLIQSNKINLNEPDKYGVGILHYLCMNNKPKMLNYLISNFPFDINLKNKVNETPLHCAFKSNAKECVKILMQNKNIDYSLKDNDGLSINDFLNKTDEYKKWKTKIKKINGEIKDLSKREIRIFL